MGLMSGYRTGESIRLLSNDRRVTSRALWALRAVLVLGGLQAIASAPPDSGGPYYALGVAGGVFVIYYLVLNGPASARIDAGESPEQVSKA